MRSMVLPWMGRCHVQHLFRRQPLRTTSVMMSSRSSVVESSKLLVEGGRRGCLIGGEWLESTSKQTFEVKDPATGETIAQCSAAGSADTALAIDAASKGLAVWRATATRQRARALRAWHGNILENVEDIATLMTLECGKPLAESRAELLYAASFVEWYSEEATRIEGSLNSGVGSDRRLVTTREPIGVAALITPWNFPAAMVTRKIAPALAAGCSVVLKPSEETPLTALALLKLLSVPPGVVNVVPTSRERTPEVGDALCTSMAVRALSFTGSTAVGIKLYAACAPTMKKLSLELGGNAPFIVLEDADITTAVDATMAAKMRNAGQTCVSPDRFLIHDKVFDAYLSALLLRLSELKLGHGLTTGVTLGPVVNVQAAGRLDALVKEAESSPTTICHVGGSEEAAKVRGGGAFYPPTVLEVEDLTLGCWAGETFGPLLTLKRFSDINEALRLANEGDAGLASYVISGGDTMRSMAVAERLDYGMVAVNSGVLGGVAHCFGGTKTSGIGREGAKHGLEEFLSDKAIVLGGLDRFA